MALQLLTTNNAFTIVYNNAFTIVYNDVFTN